MSGDNIAYNLRPNKFVERQLFVELLSILCVGIPNDRLVYVSMGGPQLEDQRLVHQRLRFQNLVSIEENEVVLGRQKFNLRPSYIDCRLSTVADFVSDFDTFQIDYSSLDKIIWFDYASPRQRYEQLTEYETVLSKMEDGDILKITLNANPKTLGELRTGESPEDIQELRRKALKQQLDGIITRELLPGDMTKKNLPSVLAEAVRFVSIRALQNSRSFSPMPLGLFVYQDGPHQMLTITVRVTQKKDIETIRTKLENGGWEYLPPVNNWKTITRINVPDLSVKERLHLEQVLSNEPLEVTLAKLPFQLHPRESTALKMLQEYARHYHRYPSYFQVIL